MLASLFAPLIGFTTCLWSQSVVSSVLIGCQYRSTCLYFFHKRTLKTHNSQCFSSKAQIDPTASVDELSHNNLNKTLRFHKGIRVNVRVSEVFWKLRKVLSSKRFFEQQTENVNCSLRAKGKTTITTFSQTPAIQKHSLTSTHGYESPKVTSRDRRNLQRGVGSDTGP